MPESKKEQIKELFEQQPIEVQKIVQDVVELENMFLHEIRPRLTEDIVRIVKNHVKE